MGHTARCGSMIAGMFLITIALPVSAQVTVGEESASREFFSAPPGAVTTDFVHQLNSSGISGTGTTTITVPAGDGASYLRQTFFSIEAGPVATPFTTNFEFDIRLINAGAVGSTDTTSVVTAVLQVLERGTFDFADLDSISGLGGFVGAAIENAPPSPPFTGTGFQDFNFTGDDTEFILPVNGSYVGVIEFLYTGGAENLGPGDLDPSVTFVGDPNSGFDGIHLNIDGATVVPEPATLSLLALAGGAALMRRRSVP